MKKYFFVVVMLSLVLGSFAEDTTTPDNKKVAIDEKIVKDENLETIKYGLDNEVISLIDDLVKNEDTSYSKDLYTIFFATNNTVLRQKIINYATIFEDDALKDYCIQVLEDPYDEDNDTVIKLIQYAKKIKIREIAPFLHPLIEAEDKVFFIDSVQALGEIGSAEDALFLQEFIDTDLTVTEKQHLVGSLGKLQAVDSWDFLFELAENQDENSFVRKYALEALGNIDSNKAFDLIVTLLSDKDPLLRQSAVLALAHDNSDKARGLILLAIKDDYYKVRLEAIKIAMDNRIQEASSSLLYRAKHDKETVVKHACYNALVVLNNQKGIEYLVSLIEKEKTSDSDKAKIASIFIDNNIEYESVISLTKKTLEDEKKKQLRYALGKKIAKTKSGEFASVCSLFLSNEDALTMAIGLDMYKMNGYSEVTARVRTIADDEKNSSIQKKAKLILQQ